MQFNQKKITSLVFGFCVCLALFFEPNRSEARDWLLYYFCGIAAVASFSLAFLFSFQRPQPATGFWEEFHFSKWDFLTVLFFGLSSLKPYQTHGSMLHHLSFFVGPAELLTQGFVPLREIPSQYGFLPYFLTAKLPFGSEWNNFLFLNRLLIFLSSLLVYFSLRLLFPAPRRIYFLFLLSFFSLFVWPGWVDRLEGPLAYPSTVGFRFLSSYLLIIVAIIIFKIQNSSKSKQSAIVALKLLGSFIWALTSLWNFESFVYASAAWVSFRFFNEIYNWVFPMKTTKKFFRFVLEFVAIFILIWGGFLIWYKSNFGGLPDIQTLWEYATVYKSGFGSIPISNFGPGWILLLLFFWGTLVTVGALVAQLKLTALGTLGVGWLWACSSYYISRSHANNLANLMPEFVLSGALFIFVFSRIGGSGILYRRSRTFLGALILFLALPLINIRFLRPFFIGFLQPSLFIKKGLIFSQKDGFNSPVDKALSDLNIAPSEPFIFLSGFIETSPTSEVSAKKWLPIGPAQAFEILPRERQLTYITRVMERTRPRGWLIFAENDSKLFPVLLSIISGNFQLISQRSLNGWRGLYFSKTESK